MQNGPDQFRPIEVAALPARLRHLLFRPLGTFAAGFMAFGAIVALRFNHPLLAVMFGAFALSVACSIVNVAWRSHALNKAGLAKLRAGDLRGALVEFETAASLHPDNVSAQNNRAAIAAILKSS